MADLPTVYVLNGPNLNLLGLREPEIYGHDTLDDIAGMLEDQARGLGLSVDVGQSNHEGHLIDWLHEARAWLPHLSAGYRDITGTHLLNWIAQCH